MEWTKEQYDIINSTGNIKINAVAGSGKTTTIIEYAKARPKDSKILYLAFNKAVKLEAARKFSEKGLTNVQVETAHSLAYRNIVYSHQYQVKSQGYKTNEVAEMLGLQSTGEKHAEYIVANHINHFVAYFCNSDKAKVQELNYLDVVFDKKARAFVSSAYAYIENKTRELLARMDRGEIEITHDFYLKKFQLSRPTLGFDYILFDEGQDASPAMLDIFFNQTATKVIVGDTHQQIYGWRHAVNSLEKADFKTFFLSTSFRFGQDIADLAMEVLSLKKHLNEKFTPIQIIGKGINAGRQTNAVLARTNLGLLLKAIECVTAKKQVKHIYFEGNINSYTYAEEGASLYDVLNLYNGKRHLIRDKLIAAMKDMAELEDYIEKTEEMQLGMMVEIVKEYGNEIPNIIKAIKDKHVDNEEKHKAEIIFSTVHRCKGMEYDTVQLVNDFITEEKLEKQKDDKNDEGINKSKINEEINLLYVAITRTKCLLHIPKPLMPFEFPPSEQINILQEISKDEKQTTNTVSKSMPPVKKTTRSNVEGEKIYNVEKIRENYKNAYQPWTEDLDMELTSMYCKGISLQEMAKHFNRNSGAIKSRIKKLELVETYGLNETNNDRY